MNDDELDRRLDAWSRGALMEAAPAAVPVARLASPQSRSRVVVALAAAVVIVAAAVTSVVLTHESRGHRPASPVVASPAPITASAPPGFRAESLHGLTVDVPATWRDSSSCCGLTVNTVYHPGPPSACPAVGPSRHGDSVRFLEARFPDTSAVVVPFLVSGRPAERVETHDGGSYVEWLYVPSLSASVQITATREDKIHAIARTARIVDVDANGCRTRVSDADKLMLGKAPSRAGADSQLIPGAPVQVTACLYNASWAVNGVDLTSVQTAKLIRALDALPAGTSVLSPAVQLPERACEAAKETYRIQADYPSGPHVVVIGVLAQCGAMGAANGSYSVQSGPALYLILAGLALPQTGPWEVVPASR